MARRRRRRLRRRRRRPDRSTCVVEGERIARIEAPGRRRPSTPAPRTVIDGRRPAAHARLRRRARPRRRARCSIPTCSSRLLRQGVTTVIGGQDGVSYAPGDGAYASEYFAAINGRAPVLSRRRGRRAARRLRRHDAAERRHARAGGHGAPRGVRAVDGCRVAGAARTRCAPSWPTGSPRAPSASRRASTTCRASSRSTAELAALAEPVAAGGRPSTSRTCAAATRRTPRAGIDEVAAIARHAGRRACTCRTSTPSRAIVHDLMRGLAASGVDATFDAYPYTRGCSILAMPILPGEPHGAARRPRCSRCSPTPPSATRLLRDWFPTIVDYPSLGPDWPGDAHARARRRARVRVGARARPWREAARRAGSDPAPFALDVLARVAARGERGDGGARRALPRRARVDPRASARARRLRRHLRRRAPASSRAGVVRPLPALARHRAGRARWPDAAALVSTRAADRFAARPARAHPTGLDRRPRARRPRPPCATVRRTTQPLALAEGIDDVLVAGVPVLAGGALAGATPGRGIRKIAVASPNARGGLTCRRA